MYDPIAQLKDLDSDPHLLAESVTVGFGYEMRKVRQAPRTPGRASLMQLSVTHLCVELRDTQSEKDLQSDAPDDQLAHAVVDGVSPVSRHGLVDPVRKIHDSDHAQDASSRASVRQFPSMRQMRAFRCRNALNLERHCLVVDRSEDPHLTAEQLLENLLQ